MRRSIYPNGSGGGSGDFVSLTTFNTYAELDAQAAEDGDLGLVASGTEGEPRLFRYATDTWIPDEPVVWTIATTGAGVMSGLIDAAGAAVYPGDLGNDGNLTEYVAVGEAGRCVFVPRSPVSGVLIGSTHSASLAFLVYKEDPRTATDVDIVQGASSMDYDSTTAGRIALRDPVTGFCGFAANGELTCDYILSGMIDVVSQGGFNLDDSVNGSRLRLFCDNAVAGEWVLDESGGNTTLTALDPTTEADVVFVYELTGSSPANGDFAALENSPLPSTDNRFPAATASATITADADTVDRHGGTFASASGGVDFSGRFVVTLTAIP